MCCSVIIRAQICQILNVGVWSSQQLVDITCCNMIWKYWFAMCAQCALHNCNSRSLDGQAGTNVGTWSASNSRTERWSLYLSKMTMIAFLLWNIAIENGWKQAIDNDGWWWFNMTITWNHMDPKNIDLDKSCTYSVVLFTSVYMEPLEPLGRIWNRLVCVQAHLVKDICPWD